MALRILKRKATELYIEFNQCPKKKNTISCNYFRELVLLHFFQTKPFVNILLQLNVHELRNCYFVNKAFYSVIKRDYLLSQRISYTRNTINQQVINANDLEYLPNIIYTPDDLTLALKLQRTDFVQHMAKQKVKLTKKAVRELIVSQRMDLIPLFEETIINSYNLLPVVGKVCSLNILEYFLTRITYYFTPERFDASPYMIQLLIGPANNGDVKKLDIVKQAVMDNNKKIACCNKTPLELFVQDFHTYFEDLDNWGFKAPDFYVLKWFLKNGLSVSSFIYEYEQAKDYRTVKRLLKIYRNENHKYHRSMECYDENFCFLDANLEHDDIQILEMNLGPNYVFLQEEIDDAIAVCEKWCYLNSVQFLETKGIKFNANRILHNALKNGPYTLVIKAYFYWTERNGFVSEFMQFIKTNCTKENYLVLQKSCAKYKQFFLPYPLKEIVKYFVKLNVE